MRDSEQHGGGTAVETWILRSLLLAILAVGIVAILGSLDDIKRYYRIKKM